MFKDLLNAWKAMRRGEAEATEASNRPMPYADDAESAALEQTPKGARLVVWVALGCVTVLIVWAAVAEIDEVARGDGKVIPSRSIQAVQSLDGGAVAELLVKEGERVQKDQPLLRVEPIRADSQVGESVTHAQALKAKLARLTAEASGQAHPAFDASLVSQSPATVAHEKDLFAQRQRELAATTNVINAQIEQRTREGKEAEARLSSASRGLQLVEKELEMMRPLAKAGAVSEVELLRLERDAVRMRGEKAESGAAVERLRAALTEARGRRVESEQSFRAKARLELVDAQSELSRLGETLKGYEDKVTKTILRAPVAGTVKTLYVKSLGAVIQPGKDVVDIVPSDDTLLLEARVQPRDIANLRAGQAATVRLSAYDFAIFGGLLGKLEYISPDTTTDDKGNAFYLVRVRTPRPEAGGHGIGSASRPIIPGMTATVDVLTGKRTLLTYLLKPILRAGSLAFTER